MKVLELFGGIGACTVALKRLKIPHEIVDYVEIDKYAVNSYNAINGTNFEPQDITKYFTHTNIKHWFGEVDLIMHGSPCQDFSIAGKQAGGNEGSGTRSSLMYETLRIVEKLKPKYVIWENVKNILSKKHFHNFENYIEYMNKLGYVSHWQVLNAKDYGIPQNRERVFTISVMKEDIINDFNFPEKQPLKLRLKDLLEDKVDEKYYINKTWHFTREDEQKHDVNEIAQINNINYKSIRSITDINKICRTIDTMGGGNREPKILINQLVRKLTPKECWRLMGFSDEDFEKAAKVNSNSQLYKQAGNSIVVNVLEEIFKNLFF